MPSSGIWQAERAEIWKIGRDRSPDRLSLRYEKENILLKNWVLWAVPLFLSSMGIMMIASLTSRGDLESSSFYGFAFRQFLFLGTGLLLMCVCYFSPLSIIRRWSWLLWLAALILTSTTWIPGIGLSAGGAQRWIKIGPVKFQPLEPLMVALPLFLATWLDVTKRENLQCFWRPTFFLAVVSALAVGRHMGGLFLVFAVCLSMHIVSKGWKWPLVAILLLAIPLGLFFWWYIQEPYRMNRILAFRAPWDDPLGRGFQIIQGLVAFSNGGIFGVGLGRGLQKLKFLPAAHTDYIFAAVGEEFGMVGTLIILSFYAAWAYKSFQLYMQSGDPYISVLIWGMAASILFPMFVNLAGVLKVMPLTGIPLPFLSYGGSAMLCMWVKVGVLLRVAKEMTLYETSIKFRPGGFQA